MNCPSCGAPMRISAGNASLRCEYCLTVVIAQADDSGMQFLDEVVELTCPVCSIPLWNATLAGVQVHACKRCHGQLLQLGFIEGLIDQLRAVHKESAIPPPVNPEDLQRKLACPRCHQRMDSHYDFIGGHTVIFGCERCQLNWLDGGALMHMVRAPHEDSNQDRQGESKPDSLLQSVESLRDAIRDKLGDSILDSLRKSNRGF